MPPGPVRALALGEVTKPSHSQFVRTFKSMADMLIKEIALSPKDFKCREKKSRLLVFQLKWVIGQAWWRIPVMPALGKSRQEGWHEGQPVQCIRDPVSKQHKKEGCFLILSSLTYVRFSSAFRLI